MDSRSLLVLLVVGCSSSSRPTTKTNVDGASSDKKSDSGFYTGDNSACPVWPLEKLFPIVGPFFYGPDDGPCSFIETDRPGAAVPRVFTITLTYDGNRPKLAETPSVATLKHRYEYTYSGDLLSTETDFKEGLLYTIAYTYDGNRATYMVTDASLNKSQYAYTLDENGYPKTLDYGTYVGGQLTTPTTGPAKFVFEYDKCKIQRRVALTAAGDPVDSTTATFSYDDAGHLVDINSPDREVVYDYACWAPLDAGSDSGPL